MNVWFKINNVDQPFSNNKSSFLIGSAGSYYEMVTITNIINVNANDVLDFYANTNTAIAFVVTAAITSNPASSSSQIAIFRIA